MAARRAHQTAMLTLEADSEHLSAANRKALKGIDAFLTTYLGSGELCEKYARFFELRQTICLSMPFQFLDVSHQHRLGDPTRRAQINHRITALLQEYAYLDQPTLTTFLSQIRANCYLAEPRRVQIYLWGPPGTGKTRFAHAAAKALGLPILPLSLSTRVLASMTERRTNYLGGCSFDRDVTDLEAAGPIALGMVEAGITNPIFFVDEASDFFISSPGYTEHLKKWLDPDRRSVTTADLMGFEADISRATFIFAGNQPIRDAAVATRCKQIHFTALDAKYKAEVLKSQVAEKIEDYHELGEERLDALRRAMEAYVPKVLEADASLGIPGVRTALEVAKEVVDFVNLTLIDPLMANESVEAFIQTSFQGRKLAS